MGAMLATGAVAPARAATWSEVFASDTATVVFLASDGGLWRAPFDLSTREVVWTPRADRLVRLAVAPGAARVAFLTRAHDMDTTRLWVWDGGAPRSRARYFAPLPQRFNLLRYEADRPTLDDPAVLGARFIQANPLMRRQAANPIAWTPDGSGVAFGYGEGLAVARADSGQARQVSEALIVSLRALEPAPIYLAEAVVLHRGLAEWGRYLVYPAPERWRIFESTGFGFGDPWSASEGTIWWADGKHLQSVRVHDPTPRLEHEAKEPIRWVEYDPGHRAVHFASERAVFRRGEDGGVTAELFAPGGEIIQVVSGSGRNVRGVVTEDSLIVWTLDDDRRLGVALAGIEPHALHEGADGTWWVSGWRARGRAAAVARIDRESRRLVEVDTPAVKNGRVVETPARNRLVLWSPDSRPPATLQVLDLASGRWTDVANPDIVGWEPLTP
jgi:hypothetical protein